MSKREIIADLQKANHHLRIENIKMRLELEALATDVNSVESLKIILKYRKLKMQRDEIDWSAQN